MNVAELNEVQTSEQINKPRYLRDKGAVAMFGIGRTKLYNLAKQGKIKSITLQEEGTSRGTRLFCVKSIEHYIESFDKTPSKIKAV